jgi:glutathione S-transferase
MDRPILHISSRNYSSWSMRGWLMTRLAGLECDVQSVSPDDPAARSELLLRSSSILLPSLLHDGISVWDTLAIGEYLNEVFPDAGMLPPGRAARARCRSICGEMHSGFDALRSSLPMNLRSRRPGFAVWSGVQSDIDRIGTIWRDCLSAHGGPFLFGARPTMADAMYAPVATRFVTYDVSLDAPCEAYVDTILDWPFVTEWIAAALREPAEIQELDAEF